MRRYATAGMSTFEDLFDRARTGTITLDHAEYPPVCDEPTGPVSFALGRTGAMIMHVRPGTCASDEFRLRLLFETGACVFSSPADLGHFCTVALAAAFEIAPSEPIGPHHAAAEANDEPVVRATASSHEDLLDELGRAPGTDRRVRVLPHGRQRRRPHGAHASSCHDPRLRVLIVDEVDPIVLDVVDDIASDGGGLGARALHHAARELLAERFANLAGDGARVRVAIEAGPPLTIRVTT